GGGAADEAGLGGDEVFEEARRRAEPLALPMEVIDAEVLLDNDHVVLHFVRWTEGDLRELVSALSTHFSMHVLLQDLTKADAAHEEHGCGTCGSGGCGSGGCGSKGCGSGGGRRAEGGGGGAPFSPLRGEKAEGTLAPPLFGGGPFAVPSTHIHHVLR